MLDFAKVQAVANKVFREPMADLVARGNPTLRGLNKMGLSSNAIYMKALTATNHGAGPVADGTAITFTGNESNTYIAPQLPWTTYTAKFKVAKRAMAQLRDNPGMLGQLLQSEIEAACQDLSDVIAADIFKGSVSNGLVGLQAVVDDANTYAGIDRSQVANANWRSIVVDASPDDVAAGEISTQLLYQMDEAYFLRNHYGPSERPDLFTGVTGAKVLTKYKALMEDIDLSSLATAHFVNQANNTGKLGINATGFMGVPFLRDRNVIAGGTDIANTGRLYMFDMSQIFLCVLDAEYGDAGLQAAYGFRNGIPVDGIRTTVEFLGNEGEYVAGYVKAYIQLATDNPARAGMLLKNIDIA